MGPGVRGWVLEPSPSLRVSHLWAEHLQLWLHTFSTESFRPSPRAVQGSPPLNRAALTRPVSRWPTRWGGPPESGAVLAFTPLPPGELLRVVTLRRGDLV